MAYVSDNVGIPFEKNCFIGPFNFFKIVEALLCESVRHRCEEVIFIDDNVNFFNF